MNHLFCAAAAIFCSASERTLPYTKTGHNSTNPPNATKLYLGCQEHVTKGPLIYKFKCSTLTCKPDLKSHKNGFPLSEGLSKY